VAGDAALRAIDPRTAFVMDDLLRGIATSGTAARARATLKRGDVAGKTGTTNESMDAWFSGYVPTLAATAWLGYDQPKSLGARETGGGVALPIWLGYMQQALKNIPEQKTRVPPSGLIVSNGEFYFSEFPPGQSVASLGLDGDPQDAAGGGKSDTLDDFLSNLAASGPNSPSRAQ
jgi:penicillin-binding protein 1A